MGTKVKFMADTERGASPHLSEAELAQFEAEGVLHLPRRFGPFELTELQQAIQQVTECGWPALSEHYSDGFFSWRGLTQANLDLARLACCARLLVPAADILGSNIRLMGTQYIVREPTKERSACRTPENPGWHRDIFGMSRDLEAKEPRCAVKMMLCLSKGREVANGPTRFLPGSHVRKEPLSIPQGEIDPPGWIDFSTEMGDVVIFENRTYHAGGLCTEGLPFRAVFFQYGYRWLGPVAGLTHPAPLLAQLTEVQRHILEVQDFGEGVYQPGAGHRILSQWLKRTSETAS